jgi:hypothetical protein
MLIVGEVCEGSPFIKFHDQLIPQTFQSHLPHPIKKRPSSFGSSNSVPFSAPSPKNNQLVLLVQFTKDLPFRKKQQAVANSHKRVLLILF